MPPSQAQGALRRKRPLELPLIDGCSAPVPPQTRFQGSKYKLLEWIWDSLQPLQFSTVLDAFGGSGCVSHFFKGKGKSVTYNDVMRSFCLSAAGIIENDEERLPIGAIEA